MSFTSFMNTIELSTLRQQHTLIQLEVFYHQFLALTVF